MDTKINTEAYHHIATYVCTISFCAQGFIIACALQSTNEELRTYYGVRVNIKQVGNMSSLVPALCVPITPPMKSSLLSLMWIDLPIK